VTSPTLGDLPDLPPVLTPPEAFSLLGIGRSLGYRLLREGRFPVQPLRLGHCLRIPTQPLLRALAQGPDGEREQEAM